MRTTKNYALNFTANSCGLVEIGCAKKSREQDLRLDCKVKTLRTQAHYGCLDLCTWALGEKATLCCEHGLCRLLGNYLIQISNECCIIKFTSFSVLSLSVQKTIIFGFLLQHFIFLYCSGKEPPSKRRYIYCFYHEEVRTAFC